MIKKLILLMSLSFFAITAMAANDPLPIAQAFAFNATKGIDSTLLVHFNIAPKYYLYKDRLSFQILSPKDITIGNVLYPKSRLYTDELLGKHQVFEDDITIPVPVVNPGNQTVDLQVNFQGCSSWGYCYPPSQHIVSVNFAKNEITIDPKKTNVVTTDNGKIATLFATHHWWLILISFLGFGILLAFTPCVLPMIPILSGIIVGHRKTMTTIKAFWLSLTYVLSMAVTYACIGLVFGFLGNSVQTSLQQPWIIGLFSLLFVVLALSMFGLFEIKLPEKFESYLATLSNQQRSGTYIGVAIMGFLATLILSPCVTPALVGALSYISQTGNGLLGASALFAMGLGMGIPLLIIGTAHGKLLPKAGAWMNAVKAFFGVLLLGVAIWLVSRIIPGNVTLLLCAILAIGYAVFLNPARPVDQVSKKLARALAIIIFVYGISALVGALMGNTDPIKPLQLNYAHGEQATKLFKPVKSIADVNQALAQAKGKQITMLDFYADWCVSCKIMEKTTFADQKVRDALKSMQVLQADVTANDQTDRELEKHFNVIAPPTILFFDRDGNEITAARIVGEMDAKKFLSHLQAVLAR